MCNMNTQTKKEFSKNSLLSKLKSKTGFSLVEVLLAMTITSIVAVATMMCFKIDLNTLNIRMNSLDSNNYYTNLNIIRNAITDGHLTRYKKVATGVVAQSDELTIRTSYFSNDVTHTDLFNVKCPPKGGNLTISLNGNSSSIAVKDVQSCMFTYVDVNGNPISNGLAATSVKLDLSYITGKDKTVKSTSMLIKMMQNS